MIHCQKTMKCIVFAFHNSNISIRLCNVLYVLVSKIFETFYIENNTWQNLYHTPYQPETPISVQGP